MLPPCLTSGSSIWFFLYAAVLANEAHSSPSNSYSMPVPYEDQAEDAFFCKLFHIEECYQNYLQLEPERANFRRSFLKKGLRRDVNRECFRSVFEKLAKIDLAAEKYVYCITKATEWTWRFWHKTRKIIDNNKLRPVRKKLSQAREAYFAEGVKKESKNMSKILEMYEKIRELEAKMKRIEISAIEGVEDRRKIYEYELTTPIDEDEAMMNQPETTTDPLLTETYWKRWIFWPEEDKNAVQVPYRN